MTICYAFPYISIHVFSSIVSSCQITMRMIKISKNGWMLDFDLKKRNVVIRPKLLFSCVIRSFFTVRNTVYKVLSKQTLILPCTSKHDMQKARNIKARPKVKCLARWFNISPKFRIQPSIQMRNHPSLHEVNKNADFMGCTSSTLGLSWVVSSAPS